MITATENLVDSLRLDFDAACLALDAAGAASRRKDTRRPAAG